MVGEDAHETLSGEQWCRAALEDWDADPYPTQYVQVEALALRSVLARLAAAETVDLDLRTGTLEHT
ncbi:MAG TPA: hypothetical protein VMW08_02190 [Acidimicrobiales bacterium]|nr:hypothetical protein [Acidimicrobiales bacterium]